MALLWAHAAVPVPLASECWPDLPRAIDHVLARALAKEPVGRYQTCGELVGEASTALGIKPTHARRRWPLVGLALVAITAAALAAALVLVNHAGRPQTAKPTTVITRHSLQRIDPKTNKLVATIVAGGNVAPGYYGQGLAAT